MLQAVLGILSSLLRNFRAFQEFSRTFRKVLGKSSELRGFMAFWERFFIGSFSRFQGVLETYQQVSEMFVKAIKGNFRKLQEF